MPFTKPKSETVAESIAAAIADIRLIENFEHEQQRNQAAAVADLADAGGNHTDATQRLILASVAVTAGPTIVEAARQRIAQRGRTIALHLQALTDELREVHEETAEIVRNGVQAMIAATLGKTAYWTNPELLHLVPRSRPVREQHAFESQNQPVARTSFATEVEEETQTVRSRVSDEALMSPQSIEQDVSRLTASISAAKQRREALKREFGSK